MTGQGRDPGSIRRSLESALCDRSLLAAGSLTLLMILSLNHVSSPTKGGPSRLRRAPHLPVVLPCKASKNSLKRIYPSVSAHGLLRHRHRRRAFSRPRVSLCRPQRPKGEEKGYPGCVVLGQRPLWAQFADPYRQGCGQHAPVLFPRPRKRDNPGMGQCPALLSLQAILCSVRGCSIQWTNADFESEGPGLESQLHT